MKAERWRRGIRSGRPCAGPLGGRPSGSPLRVLILTLLFVSCGSPAPQKPGEAVDLLISGGTVITMDEGFAIHEPGFVAVRDDRILAVGALSEARGYRAENTLDATGKIVMPGLINGHQHAAMTLLRGLGSDLKLMDWLNDYIFPAEAKNVDPHFVYWGTLLSATEMLESGTTTYVDVYYFEEEAARATAKAGMRGILGQTVIGFPAPDYKTPREALQGAEEFIRSWKDDPLITPAIAPHAPYTCSEEVLRQSRELAEELDVPLLIHLAETRDEVDQVVEKTGFRPVAFLNRIGLLVDRLVAAHVVWANPEEIRLLVDNGVGVIHNPESNMKLASGTAPVPELLEAGVAIGLGTDGAASNNNLDLFQEMDTMAKLHKLAAFDPTVIPAREALVAATIGGARALNLEAELGSLEAGKKADLVVLNLDQASAVPAYDPYALIVYSLSGSAVETVLVNGRQVVRDGAIVTIDRRELWHEVERLRRKVLSSLQNEGS